MVSGFALGADSVAHRAARDAGGSTVCVMPCGLDRPFPPENRTLWAEFNDYRGAVLLSEFPFGTAAASLTLRKRNKTIVGLALGALIGQSSPKGGAMNAFRFALEQRKPIATFSPDDNEDTGGNRKIAESGGTEFPLDRQKRTGMGSLAADAVVVDLDGTVWDSAPWYGALADATGRRGSRRPYRRATPEGGRLHGTDLRQGVRRRQSPSSPLPRGRVRAREPCERGDRAWSGDQPAPLDGAGRCSARPVLRRCFSTVIDYGVTSRRKPQPDPLLEACRRIGCAPDRAWYVGDDPNDAKAAAAAQMPFAWASWGYTSTSAADSAARTREPGRNPHAPRGAGVKYVYKIYSKYDGFTPARIPRQDERSKTLRLGWKHYVDVVEPGDEIWVYFHGPHRFDNGVYAKGIAEDVLYDDRIVLLRVTEYSTVKPLTDPRLSARIASVVSIRNRQVFVLPEELDTAPVCTMTTTAASCKAHYLCIMPHLEGPDLPSIAGS